MDTREYITAEDFYLKWRKECGLKVDTYRLNQGQIVALMQDYRDYLQVTPVKNKK